MPPKLPGPDKIERKYIGTRVGFTLAAIGCYFGTLTSIQVDPGLNTPETWDTLRWLIGALSIAIVGDTARPSGMKKGAFGVTQGPSGNDG
jgi:hypothetical protein